MIDYSQNPLWVQTGYQPLTTYWTDFNIANVFGIESIKETYDNGLAFCKSDYKLLTEFIMVLNHQCWKAVQINRKIAEFYSGLFTKTDTIFFKVFGDNEKAIQYYLKVTD